MECQATFSLYDENRKCLAKAPPYEIGIPEGDEVKGVTLVQVGHAVELKRVIEETTNERELLEVIVEFLNDIDTGDIPGVVEKQLKRINGEPATEEDKEPRRFIFNSSNGRGAEA